MYKCDKCGESWEDKKALENELFCTRKCGGRLFEAVDSNEPPLSSGPVAPPQELFSFIIDKFPSVVAIPFQEYLTETNPVMKLWYACDTVELTLRLFVTIGVADIRRQGQLSDKFANELKNRIEEPTLGKWKGMALAASSALPKDTCVPELPGGMKNDWMPFLDGTVKPATIESSFSELRNHLAHGGGITKAVAQNLLVKWAPRFEELMKKTEWISEIKLLVQKNDGSFGMLCGPQAEPQPFTPETVELTEKLKTSFSRDEEIAIVRKGTALSLPLWPLALFGSPKLPADNPAKPPERKFTPQMYVRRGEVSLHFTPLGSKEACHSESDSTSMEAFIELFRLRDEEKADFKIPGFEKEIKKDSSSLIGRKAELDAISRLLKQTAEGVLWLTGTAGIGKSFLVARIAHEMMIEPPENTLVLPYRFKAGDGRRCGREPFLQFAIERLKPWVGVKEEVETEENDKDKNGREDKESVNIEGRAKKPESNEPIDVLKDLLKNLPGRKVLFILDGLDEIAERDATFAKEIPLAIAYPGVVWFCAGRPDHGLDKLFSPDRCSLVFPNGVEPMGSDDIRAMLLEKIGPLRWRLLAGDEENIDGKVLNPFIEKVEKSAQGLPIYVKYVIGDILNNKYRALDAGEELPASLNEYYEKLLRDCRISDLNQVLTPLACTLALSKEPLSKDELLTILAYGKALAEENGEMILDKALSQLGAMIRRVEKSPGIDGYTLCHLTLRQHFYTSSEVSGAIAIARKNLCEMACDKSLWNGKAGIYLLRWGPTHLIETERWDDVEKILLEIEFLESKVEAGMAVELLEDFGRLGFQKFGPVIVTPWVHEDKTGVRCPHCLAWSEIKSLNSKFSCPICNHPLKINPFTINAEWQPCGAKNEFVKFVETPSFPEDHPKVKLFELIGKALAFDLHFIERHPETLFQCLWNRCWWYDCPEAESYYEEPEGGWNEANAPWRKSGFKLYKLCEKWKKEKEYNTPGFNWLRTKRPPAESITSPQLAIFQSNSATILSVCFSPDGTKMASASTDSKIWIWDMMTGKQINTLAGHEHTRQICFSPDGQRLLSGGDDNELRIWDVFTGKQIAELTGHLKNIRSVCFSQDGSKIASGSDDGTVRIWNAITGEFVRELKDQEFVPCSVCFSPDGSRIVSGGYDKAVRIWDVSTGSQITKITGHFDFVKVVCYSPDGSKIALACSEDTLRVWNTVTEEFIYEFNGGTEMPNEFYCICFSPDSTKIAWGREMAIKVLDLTEKKHTIELTGRSSIISACFSPDGSKILYGDYWGSIRLWSAENIESAVKLKGHSDYVLNTCYSSDGSKIASCSLDKTVRIWDVITGRQIIEITGLPDCGDDICFSPKGNKIALRCRDKTVRIWDAITGIPDKVLKCHSTSIFIMKFSPDGSKIASGCFNEDKILKIFDVESGRQISEIEGNYHPRWSICFSPDGKIIATAGGFVKYIKTPKSSLSPYSQFYELDGVTYELSLDNSIRLWDVVTGKQKKELKGYTGITNPCFSRSDLIKICFSPDGKTLVSGGGDKIIRVWDIAQEKLLYELKGHDVSVSDICFSSDGRKIISKNDKLSYTTPDEYTGNYFEKIEYNSSVRVWDAFTGDCLEVINGCDDAVSVANNYPYYIRKNIVDNELVLESIKKLEPILFLNDFSECQPLPDGRSWVAQQYNHVQIITLEGNAVE